MLAWRTWKVIFFLFFPLQDVCGHEFDEFIVENIENLAAYYVKFGLLSGQIVLKHLDKLAAAVHHVGNCDRA